MGKFYFQKTRVTSIAMEMPGITGQIVLEVFSPTRDAKKTRVTIN